MGRPQIRLQTAQGKEGVKLSRSKLKTLLIYPPFFASEASEGYVSAGAPLGITMLGASLRDAGFQVELLDAFIEGFGSSSPIDGSVEMKRVSNGFCKRNKLGAPFNEGFYTFGLDFDEIKEEIRKRKPDIVGVSIIFSSIYPAGRHIARLAKEVDEGIITVIGGNHSTAVPGDVLAEEFVDYALLGEGEKSFLELVKCLSDGKHERAARLPGIASRDFYSGKITVNPQELIPELDALPYPAFDLLPIEKHFAVSAEGRTIKIMTSRGCTFDCCFCTVPGNSKRRFRARSPEDVLAEIDLYVEKYRIEGVMFEDDNMTLNQERARRIFQMIGERGYGLKLFARNFRADLFDLDMLKLMKKAGFETIWITPESGNQEVLLNLIGKNFNLKDVDRSVKLIKEAGLRPAAAFVIGIPGETRSDIDDTVRYAWKLKRDGVKEFWISIATPIVGTRMYADSVKMGLVSGMDLERFSYQEAGISTDSFRGEEMVRLRRSLMAELNDYKN